MELIVGENDFLIGQFDDSFAVVLVDDWREVENDFHLVCFRRVRNRKKRLDRIDPLEYLLSSLGTLDRRYILFVVLVGPFNVIDADGIIAFPSIAVGVSTGERMGIFVV